MIEIKHRHTDEVLFSWGSSSMKDAVEAAVKLGVSLAGANLENAYLSEANLSGANLEGASFYRSDLRRANLRGANLSHASFGAAILRGADLSGANLSWAYFHRALLNGSNLNGANLSSSYLVEAVTSFTEVMTFCLGQHSGFAHFGDQYPDGSICQIGCEEHSLAHWLKHYEEITRRNGYSDDQVKAYGLQLKLLQELQEKNQ